MNGSFEALHRQYDGRWREVLPRFGISAATLDGKHHPCPGCGGKDRFRFDDKNGRGTWICSQGGGDAVAGDAFALLVHTGRAQDSSEALKLVNESFSPEPSQPRSATLKTAYEYLHADGSLSLTVTRVDYDDGSKTFSQQTARGLKPKDDEAFVPVPYNLPAIAANPGATVYIVEGEKCADALNRLGLVATCNAGGAGNWQSALNDYFAGRDIVVLPDNDEGGKRHLEVLTDNLQDAALSMRVCRCPVCQPRAMSSIFCQAATT